MNLAIIVLFIFISSCILSAFFVIKKPRINISIINKKLRIETYFLGVLIGAILLLLFQILPWNEAVQGVVGSGNLSPIGILILFLSMVFMSIFLDKTGFFEYCANLALKYSKGNAKKLFFSVYITVSILTIFTSNDIVILTFTPFVYYIAKYAKLNPTPYLFAEFFAANTWSMILYIGNPTNIIVASALNLDFLNYTYYMLLPTIAAGIINLLLLYLIFRKKINIKQEFEPTINTSKIIKDKFGTIIGLTLLLLCIITLAFSSKLGFKMWHVAFVYALILATIILIRRIFYRLKQDDSKNELTKSSGLRKTINSMPWSIVPFVLSLFIMVHALNIFGITSKVGIFLAEISSGSVLLTTLIYGFSSAISANFLNNIPMTISFIPIIGEAGVHMYAAALATTIGSNLGANITPFGALAGIMWLSILKEKGAQIKIIDFIKYGSLITFFALSAALIILGLEFRFM